MKVVQFMISGRFFVLGNWNCIDTDFSVINILNFNNSHKCYFLPANIHNRLTWEYTILVNDYFVFRKSREKKLCMCGGSKLSYLCLSQFFKLRNSCLLRACCSQNEGLAQRKRISCPVKLISKEKFLCKFCDITKKFVRPNIILSYVGWH